MNTTTVEIIGYIGSALVLVSFLMASVVKLRVVNAIGSGIFAAYALIIHSYPTMIMNICLVLINLYYLWKLRNSEPNYRLLRVSPQDGYLAAFLEHHKADIAACFPGRRWDVYALDRAYLVSHGDETAGVLMGTTESGTLRIALDYTTPTYRDASVARYLLDHLREEEYSVLRYENAEPAHLAFLKKMGYSEQNGAYELSLKK